MKQLAQSNTTMQTSPEHSHGDMLPLEQRREQLCVALQQAWLREDYPCVVSLVTDLAYFVGRFTNIEEGEQVLLLGIQASRYLHDQHHLAQFLSRLAGLLCTRDRFAQALQVWQESGEIAQELGYPVSLWEPLHQVAHIADLLGTYGLSQPFAERLVHAERVDDPKSVLLALFIRGFHARISGERNAASNDFTACLRLLAEQYSSSTTSPYTHFFLLEVQTELARTHDIYAQAKGYGEATIALARAFCDPYTVTALLCDQAYFAYQQGMFNDASLAVQHLLDLTERDTPYYHRRYGLHLLELLTSHSQELPITLSTREHHILQLVAAGLSNKEIATALVITTGTVKKHIEHIYIKLDARSRTHAVAKARRLNILP